MRAMGLVFLGAAGCVPDALQWRTSAATELGPVSLSAQAPEQTWDVRITVGDALVVGGFELSSAVVVRGENRGGAGRLDVYLLDGEPSSASEPIHSEELSGARATPEAVYVEALLPEPLPNTGGDFHLLLRLEGAAEVTGEADMGVSARGPRPEGGDQSLDIAPFDPDASG
jgi:hypothetical protein